MVVAVSDARLHRVGLSNRQVMARTSSKVSSAFPPDEHQRLQPGQCRCTRALPRTLPRTLQLGVPLSSAAGNRPCFWLL